MHNLKHPATTANTLWRYVVKMDFRSFITNAEFVSRLGIFYAVKELARVYRNKQLKELGSIKWVFQNFINGGLAGLVTISLTYPFNIPSSILFARLAKWNTFQSLSLTGYHHYWHLIRKTLDVHYRGFLLSSVNTVLYRGILYGFFDSLKVFFKKDFIAQTLLGTVSAGIASATVYPLTVIVKNKILNRDRFKSNYESYKGIVKIEGLKGFYRGVRKEGPRSIFAGVSIAAIEYSQCAVYPRINIH